MHSLDGLELMMLRMRMKTEDEEKFDNCWLLSGVSFTMAGSIEQVREGSACIKSIYFYNNGPVDIEHVKGYIIPSLRSPCK